MNHANGNDDQEEDSLPLPGFQFMGLVGSEEWEARQLAEQERWGHFSEHDKQPTGVLSPAGEPTASVVRSGEGVRFAQGARRTVKAEPSKPFGGKSQLFLATASLVAVVALGLAVLAWNKNHKQAVALAGIAALKVQQSVPKQADLLASAADPLVVDLQPSSVGEGSLPDGVSTYDVEPAPQPAVPASVAVAPPVVVKTLEKEENLATLAKIEAPKKIAQVTLAPKPVVPKPKVQVKKKPTTKASPEIKWEDFPPEKY